MPERYLVTMDDYSTDPTSLAHYIFLELTECDEIRAWSPKHLRNSLVLLKKYILGTRGRAPTYSSN